MFQSSVRTMGVLAVVVRWLMFLLVGVGWQVRSQTVQQTSDVDSSYNFYYEQPCCSGTITKRKYHVRHRGGKFLEIILLFIIMSILIYIFNYKKNNCRVLSLPNTWKWLDWFHYLCPFSFVRLTTEVDWTKWYKSWWNWKAQLVFNNFICFFK